MIALALTEQSVHYEDVDPRLSEHAWQLAADLMLEYDLVPQEIVEELDQIGVRSENNSVHTSPVATRE